MVEKLEPGTKLQALYDDQFYPATVVQVSQSAKRAKAPVKVHYTGYADSDDKWLNIDSLKSKLLPKPKPKAKAKAKAKVVEMDYSGLTKGTRLQVYADEKWFQAEVLAVKSSKATAPVKIRYSGYATQYDEWVGSDRIRSRLLQPKTQSKEQMPASARRLLLVKPQVEAPLDPGFRPLILAKKKYLEATKDCKDKLEWALPRADGCARYSLPVFDEKSRDMMASVYLAGVLIQEMLWQRSASELKLAGPPRICKAIKKAYSKGGRYEFDILQMPRVCGTPETPFTVSIVDSADDLPPAKDSPVKCGTVANGCRLAFDLGKSDIKTVAVKDGEVLYSKETEWDVTNPDPDYHYTAIMDAMKLAKEALPGGKIDAIGGSATGTVSADNEATWCDIFPNVPPHVYKAKVVDIFKRMAHELAGGEVPLKVINDGEVTALAAFSEIKAGNVLGISMGSSEGAGYANADGNLMGWISELCYVKLDMNPKAPTDPWSNGTHTGLSHMYLGQRGATKLAPKAGIELPDNLKYPHKDMCSMKHEHHANVLKLIQKGMTDPEKESKVRELYVTVGVYLGYALAQYCEFYAIDHVMILGRVSKGAGGDLMLETAKRVLVEEFPEHSKIEFHTADDHFKGVGQCIAAAALPTLK